MDSMIKPEDFSKAICDDDPEATNMYKKFRESAKESYKRSYERLNIHFNEYAGESLVIEESMRKVEERMNDASLVEELEEVTVVKFSKYVLGRAKKALGKALIWKKYRTDLYLTPDGALFGRYERFKFDKMIYVVGAEQELHVKSTLKTLR